MATEPSASIGTTRIPRLPGFDHSLALMRDPYHFISRRCQQLRSDVIEIRLLLRKTLCMTGREAAQVFYDPRLFKRAGAAPVRLQQSLLGVGGVQMLDGAQHAERKRMHLSLMTPPRMELLGRALSLRLRASAKHWSDMERVVLYKELHPVLTRSVCEWAGVPLPESDVRKRARQFTAMFDRAGAVGPAHWWSRHSRNQAELWICEIIEDIRSGRLISIEHSATDRLAWFRDSAGTALESDIAAVELINVIRPTVAISVYIVFMAHALHVHPDCRRRLESGDADYTHAFVQEVRRFYPFFPAVMAIVRESFEWRGHWFPAGMRALLDLHGVNHDARLWKDPEQFRPERFCNWREDAFTLIPQGGGEQMRGHRCSGEAITIALMKTALHFLVTELSYTVPPQDLTIDDSRLPALPRSRFIVSDVRLR